MLLRHESEQNVLIDNATGDLPYRATRDGVYNYTLDDDVWRLKYLLVDDYVVTNDYFNNLDNNHTHYFYQQNQFEEYLFCGRLYYRVKQIRSFDRRNTTAAHFTFVGGLNPGATTEIFRELAYREPVNITSDNVQHEMPGSTDMDYLVPATMALIDAINDHEKTVSSRQYILKELKPNFWNEADGGAQGISDYCIKRSF